MLIETLIAAVLMIITLTGAFMTLDIAARTAATTRGREGATNLAREILEDARTIPYGQITPTSLIGDLQAMNGLAPASSSSVWQVARRGYTYTVTVSECSIDDPTNGYGVHDSTFCPDSSVTGTADPQPANLKRITADVAWTVGARTRDVQQVETLSSAGQAIGPPASGLQLSAPAGYTPTAPVITAASVTQLTFTVTAPAAATAVNWTLDGSSQIPAPTASGTTWTFTWPISGLSDGTYLVGAQAVDATGVAGPPVSMSVALIRSVPVAPTGIVGGFNTVGVAGVATPAAELRWKANSERNVIGYHVYSPTGLVCPASATTLSLATSCTDLNPPAQNSANLTYSVSALYRDATGALKEGAAGTLQLVAPPSPPNAPGSLTATGQANGTVLLSWSAPSTGAAVSFYRIYRDGTDYTARYDYTGAGSGSTTYSDANPGSSIHNYYVTAVSAALAESPILGPAHP